METDRNNNPDQKWYVLRCHSMSAAKVCAALDGLEIEWFQPYSEAIVTENGRKVKRKVCLMKDYVFVHSTKDRLTELIEGKRIAAWFYYDLCHRVHHEPLFVRDKEMEDFMRVSTEYDRNPQVHRLEDMNLIAGTRIRILNGPFQGVEGTYIQLKRGARKEMVVKLSNFLTVSVKLTSDELVEVLDG